MAQYISNTIRGYKTILNLWEIRQEIENSRTLIGYSWEFYQDGARSNKNTTRELWINGSRLYYETGVFNTQQYPFTYNFVITAGEMWINHDINGNKKITISTGIYGLYNTGSITCSDTMTLTWIPRQATITDAPNFNDEANPTIKYNNPLGNNATSLEACISLTGATDDINYRNISKNETSYQFNLIEEERNILREATKNSNSRKVFFCIRTIIGATTLLSKVEKTLSIVDANPIFNDFTYKDIGLKSVPVTENNKLLIKDYSNIELTINKQMIAKKMATPKHYVITLDNRVITVNSSDAPISVNIDNINFSGNKRLSVRAYDSRNNSTEIYKDVLILNYNKPNVYATLERKNQFEKETTLKISGKYDEVKINNIAKNQLNVLKYRYRETSGILSEWVNVSFTLSNGNFNCNDIILNLDNVKSFDFEIYCEDKLTSERLNISVGVGIPDFFISSNKKAIGVNCIPPENAEEGEIYFRSSDGVIKQVLDYDIIEEWEE